MSELDLVVCCVLHIVVHVSVFFFKLWCQQYGSEVKSNVTKPEYLNLVLGTSIVYGEQRPLKVVLRLLYVQFEKYTPTHASEYKISVCSCGLMCFQVFISFHEDLEAKGCRLTLRASPNHLSTLYSFWWALFLKVEFTDWLDCLARVTENLQYMFPLLYDCIGMWLL